MSIKETIGYCPSCKSNVLLKREEINIPLVIILIIFTGGFLVLIYFLIYYNKEPDRCVHCDNVCKSPSHEESQSSECLISHPLVILRAEGEKAKFCPICGVKLAEREAIKFCALCGGEIE